MGSGFGKHYMADLYFCQKRLWDTPLHFIAEITKLADSFSINGIRWEIDFADKAYFRICGEFEKSFLLLQVFPDNSFATIDLYCWNPQINIQLLSESLIELFSPQVVSTETRLRAEHLN